MQVLFIPLYFQGINGNFFFMKPDFKFFCWMIIFVLFQILTFKIQEKKPRFMLPKFVIRKLVGDYYEYNHDFEEDANLSSSSFLTPLLDNQPRSRTNQEDPASVKQKTEFTKIRLEKLKSH